jgi:hypothetical protein
LNLGIAAHRSLWFESEELRRKVLPIGEDGRQVLGEVADLARQNLLALPVERVSGLHPGRYERFARLEKAPDLH